MRRNKDLASLFELQEATLRGVASAIDEGFQPIRDPGVLDPGNPYVFTPVTRTTLPGGGQRGDTTGGLSAEYGDELEN